MSARGFLRDTRAGATGFTAAAVTVMAVGGAALIGDHVWLVDQRDVLKTAADAAAVAASLEMKRQLARQADTSNAELKQALEPVAERYVLLNLGHLPEDRLARAEETLVVEVVPDRAQGTVDVSVEADLGGTLFASRLPLLGGATVPESIRADARVECTTNLVEVVLAFDVTHSMNQPFGTGRRIDGAIDAARALLEVLWSGCADARVAVGIVPWDRSVRVPDPDAWEDHQWVDSGPYRSVPTGAHYDWAGCLEDRAHNLSASGGSPGLSLELPARTAFRAYLYPNTEQLDPAIIDQAYARLSEDLSEAIAGLGEDAVRERLRLSGDNHWGQPLRGVPGETGGPNARCTKVAMLPLTAERDAVARTLDALDALAGHELWQGGTMAHLGVTWARRMLAPGWRRVWGDETHPVATGEAGTVKAVVLLTDGENWAGDRPESLPGRLFACYRAGALEFVDANGYAAASCAKLGKHHTAGPPDYASTYSALGRLGAVRREDGGSRTSLARSARIRTEAAWVLNELLRDSCEAARDEGLALYTVSMSRNATWNDLLLDCSGTAHTGTDDERSVFRFMGDEPAAIQAAFREIGQRLLSVRRVH